MANTELQQRIVNEYDRMTGATWERFAAFCEQRSQPTSLMSFVDYLVACEAVQASDPETARRYPLRSVQIDAKPENG